MDTCGRAGLPYFMSERATIGVPHWQANIGLPLDVDISRRLYSTLRGYLFGAVPSISGSYLECNDTCGSFLDVTHGQ